MTNDIGQSPKPVNPSVPSSSVPPIPPICSRCEIPIFDGYTHINMIDCLIAIKDYLKVYQDDLEKRRMEDMQHPTRDELLHHLKTMAQQFDHLASYAETLAGYVRQVLRVTLLPYANQAQDYDRAGRSERYPYTEESARIAERLERIASINVDPGIIRELLSPDVPYSSQNMVPYEEVEKGSAYYPSPKQAPTEQVRPPLPEQ